MNKLKYRKKKRWTQEELAEKLGVSFQAISKCENAKSTPDTLFLPTMADLLIVLLTICFLMFRKK